MGPKLKPLARFNLFLTMAIAILTAIGCGGVWLIASGERVQNADRKFDEAEAFLIRADKETEHDKWRDRVAQKKTLYDEALNAYRAIVKAEPTGKYAQRSLWQISEIYRRRYEWDEVIENYNAIITVAPSGYYAERAKSGIADMRKYRGLIDEEQRKYEITVRYMPKTTCGKTTTYPLKRCIMLPRVTRN